MKSLFAVLPLLLLFTATAASGHGGEVHTYMGTVTMLHKDGSFMMKKTDATEMTVLTSKNTKYLHANNSVAKRSELARGMRVVVRISKDGKTALSVKMSAAPYDLQFIDSLIRHHQMAVDMANAGEAEFAHPALRKAARKMIEDQSKEIAQLRQWRDQWYPGAAPAENMQMPGMSSTSMDLSHLRTMSGQALDLMFLEMMIPHHEGALAVAQDALLKAEHQELKDLARKIIEAQRKEIDQMQQWKKAWAK